MVIYQCPRCHYETNRKDDMRRHYNRKRICKTTYSRKSMKDCLKELEIKKKRKSYDELQRELTEIKQQIIVNGDNNTMNNCGNTNNINIHVNAYNKVDLDLIDTNTFKECLVDDKLDMGKLMNKIFYDNEKNHSIYIANTNNRRIMEYDGDNFIEKGKNEDGLRMVMVDLKNIMDKFEDNDIVDEFDEIYQKCMIDNRNDDFPVHFKEDIRNMFNKMASALVNGKIKVKKTFLKNRIKIKKDGTCEKM